VVNGAIHEEEQTAVILMDTGKKRETIILQTNVRSDQDRVAVFFMPLPAKPDVQLAPPDAVTKTLELVRHRKLTCERMASPLTEINVGGGGLPDARPGINVVLHKRIGVHQVTTVELKNLVHFRRWAVDFLARNRVSATFDFDRLEAVVQVYFRDDLRFFLFDLIALTRDTTTMKPLAISFASEHIYYPLRVNRLYTGKSDVLLMVFTDVEIPRGRFERIGFASSSSIRITRDDRQLLGSGLNGLLPKRPLQFQCFLLEDPRGMYPFLQRSGGGPFADGHKPSAIELYARLHKEAMVRWEHDVRLSLTWGRRHVPDYQVKSPARVALSIMGLDY